MHRAIQRLLVFSMGLPILAACWDPGGPERSDPEAVEQLAARWVEAVATRDPAFVDLLSPSSQQYLEQMRHFALHADADGLQHLDPLDQVQALLLRLTFDSQELERMSRKELHLAALGRGFFGNDLRATDVLREIRIDGDSAAGRLYKFGLADRPDSGLQYFTHEGGEWRVELRGELERRSADFEALVARAGLPESEVAFFILEMRLLRKVVPNDFVPPRGRSSGAVAGAARPTTVGPPELRVIAIRRDLGDDASMAATIEDRRESLRYVLQPGDPIPGHSGYRLDEIRDEEVVISGNGEEIVSRLGEPDGRRRVGARERSLFSHAQQGAARKGLMAQWRNVGLRGRAQLLQQASLVPIHPQNGPPGSRILGLRVSTRAQNSLWHQLGLEQGDVLIAVNERPIDSLDAWHDLLDVAERATTIRIDVQRAGEAFRYETRTTDSSKRRRTTHPSPSYHPAESAANA